ncbi:hypothetical protein FGO68_gene8028 [Halteria grandinella]|uniref:Uncharacterized protein n=1 Tax=Halteria grandinella TaxID=5974 RepID=A0A8J8NIX5_HALGN|nr:hypothetical protein FGO68_gene8028 [Halteria grandinella]
MTKMPLSFWPMILPLRSSFASGLNTTSLNSAQKLNLYSPLTLHNNFILDYNALNDHAQPAELIHKHFEQVPLLEFLFHCFVKVSQFPWLQDQLV